MAEPTEPLNIANKFGVASHAGGVAFLFPVPRQLNKADAMLLAAWIVAITDEDDQFAYVLEKVLET